MRVFIPISVTLRINKVRFEVARKSEFLQRLIFMPFTKEEGGRLNNFAPETKTYLAEPPTSTQKRNYLVLGMGALVLVGGLLFVAYSASNIS